MATEPIFVTDQSAFDEAAFHDWEVREAENEHFATLKGEYSTWDEKSGRFLPWWDGETEL